MSRCMPYLALFGFILLQHPLYARTFVIDFSNLNFPDGTILTNEFTAQGIVFSASNAGLSPGILCPPFAGQENLIQQGILSNLYRLNFLTTSPVVEVAATFRDHNLFRQIHSLYGLDGRGNVFATSSADDLFADTFTLQLSRSSGIASIVACELPFGAESLVSLRYTTSDAPSCISDNVQLCLNHGRFRVTATWRTSESAGSGSSVQLTDDSGYFTFFATSNVEMVIKVLDACSFNSKFWVFAGGLTNVEVTITVEDIATGLKKIYQNPLGTVFKPIQDVSAFATCP